jgi:hypothetical protein
MAVHPVARVIKIGNPVSINPHVDPVQERLDIKHKLESAMHELYLSAASLGQDGFKSVKL